MSILDWFRPKMTRYENNGRWCEVEKQRCAYFNGDPCYELDGRGDWGVFLSGADPLDVVETQDGWTIWYRPNDDSFDEYAAELIEIDAWR